ncbi:hypothetical protein N825_32640 [Skermanella stibiiresistens SB22]|uniref:Uncharacterized protein n=1 Tax=Skermanella stibiiresistens SB22 TaxID=1385369 RepID=W9GPN2_9PROT|nr:hypothetical protein N825_32640 [Skermanella stibiiresistens SB22]
MADDVGRKTVTMVRIRDTFHPATMPHTNAGTVMNFVLGEVILRQKETLNGPTQRSCYP